MKVLIHDERSDALDFLLGSIVNYGYRAGIAKDIPEIMSMLSNDHYDIILINNGSYGELGREQCLRMKLSPVFIIGIKGPQRRDEGVDPDLDFCLHRPFEASKLRQAIGTPLESNVKLKRVEEPATFTV